VTLSLGVEQPSTACCSSSWDGLVDHSERFGGSFEFQRWRALVGPFPRELPSSGTTPRCVDDGPMLITEDRDEVAVLRIEHGRVGALDVELLNALTEAVTASDRALVITGSGSSFSAGVDLRRILDGGRPYTEELLAALSRTFRVVFDHPRPTVAAVNGHAIAGGCVLALACDLRLMSGGRIGLTELAVGVPFPASALEIVRHALGSRAGQVLLGAQTADRERALALGMVDELTEPGELLPRALALATELAARSPESYRLAKTQLHRPANAAIEATAGGDAAVLAGWTSDGTRRRIEAALAALARR
jgi:enoyl-CoA hydratase